MTTEEKKKIKKLGIEKTDDGKISLTIGRSNPVIEEKELSDLVTLLIGYTYMEEKGVTGLSFEEGKFTISGPMVVVDKLMSEITGNAIASGERLPPQGTSHLPPLDLEGGTPPPEKKK